LERRPIATPIRHIHKEQQRISDQLLRKRPRSAVVLHGGADLPRFTYDRYLTVSLAFARTVRGGGTRW
jgi:hypothetical protein